MNSAALLLKVVVAASLLMQQPTGSVKPAAAMQVRPLPVEAVNVHGQLAAKLSAPAKTKVMGAAMRLRAQLRAHPAIDAAQVQSQARAAASQAFPSLEGMDIDTVAFMVMMQASNDAQNDLKATMNQVQAANQQKQAMRDATNKVSEPGDAIEAADAAGSIQQDGRSVKQHPEKDVEHLFFGGAEFEVIGRWM